MHLEDIQIVVSKEYYQWFNMTQLQELGENFTNQCSPKRFVCGLLFSFFIIYNCTVFIDILCFFTALLNEFQPVDEETTAHLLCAFSIVLS